MADPRRPPLDDCNEWADFWRFKIGVNIIPADTMSKKPLVAWLEYHDKPISQYQHEQWKARNAFSKGMAIIPGKVWHREEKKGQYFIFIDIDIVKGIEELCTRNGKEISLQEISKKFLVEQHKDSMDKAHIYFYSPIPFIQKTADPVIGIEIKSLGAHGIAFCSPSIHKNGHQYEVIGTIDPIVLNIIQARELMQHINQICIKYGVEYLEKLNGIDNRLKTVIKRLSIDPDVRIPLGARHATLIAVADSLLFNNIGIRKTQKEKLKDFFIEVNKRLCHPEPLPEKEINSIWNSALDFVYKIKEQEKKQHIGEVSDGEIDWNVVSITEELLGKYEFKTMSDTDEICYYDKQKGVYTMGGEILIKTDAEEIAPEITTSEVNEIINKIKRRKTYILRSEFDSKQEILNLKNGLLNIQTEEFKGHSPGHLSVVQLPITYNPRAHCPLILKYLGEVLHARDVFTALEIIGYCLYKSGKYEKAVMLFGSGDNGKGVFVKLIEAFLGQENTSHVPLQELDNDRFAAADLYGKLANTFSDLKSEKLSMTGTFKTIVSGDSIRAQKKYGQPFSFRNYAKLIFSANRIPDSEDKSYAYYKRWLILQFEKVFERECKDAMLIDKLTTEEELSGLLNLALIALRQLQKNGGFSVIPVEKVRKEYERNSNIVKAFLDDRCIIDLADPESYTLTSKVYSEYITFCKKKNERPLELNVFGKKLAEQGIEKPRITYFGQREYCYIGIRMRSDIRGKNQSLY
jgi:P4 family phage/plasmid primase-like protien